MKFLIAGLGSIGRRHLKNLLALGENDIILYRTGKSTLPDDELQGFATETDLTAALNHKPDAVIVANPTAFHLDVAIPAAEAGCHLLIEKPISHSLEGMERLQAAVERNDLKVLVGYQFRFHPGLIAIHQWMQEGRMGKLLYVRAHWGEYLPGWHPWEDYRRSYAAREEMGGGVLLTLSHPLDYLRWLIGEPEILWGWKGRQSELELDVEDTVELVMRFSNHALGSLHLDYLQKPPDHHLMIVGELGTCQWSNFDGRAQLFDSREGAWITHDIPVAFERNDLFLREMEHFLQVLRGNSVSICNLNDGIAILKLASSIDSIG
jgi:predicted dehydrogenase